MGVQATGEAGIRPVEASALKTELDQELASAEEARADGEAELARKAESLVQSLLVMGTDDEKAREQARSSIELMSERLQREAARKSASLKEPIHLLSQRADDGGTVANALVDLKMQVEALDPNRFDFSPGWFSRLLGYLPFVGTPVKRYFSRYESASTVIEAIVGSLEDGREQLKRDNITLQADQAEMREMTRKLMQAVRFGQQIDAGLSGKLDNEIPSDDPRYQFIQEDLLFPLRQRIQDLQQQLAVNQQGVLTAEIIIRNNKELIRGVNRATNVTVNALQIAVTLALALAKQRIVLEKLESINSTTDALIANSATQLRQQGAAIHRQASSTQVNIETLRQAFAEINGALDDISSFRREAMPAMKQNIAELDGLAERAETAISLLEDAPRYAPIEIELS